MSPQTNVERLRQANVLPSEATLRPEDEQAINNLTTDEVEAVLAVHSKVGTIALKDPIARLFIF